jgi:type I restriction enzyme S subunit
MNLNKEKWNTYRFDSFVENISERVKPTESDSTIYVGLEHLDSDKIKITRWDKPEVVKGVKLKFYKGDIIFGKRRAYQRKAGIAKMDGICSAHSMVLRAKKETISDFLIFFIHSNSFMNRAMEISEGSLSPTIKWKTLAKQEFKLPPKDEQKKILCTLLTLEKQIEQTEDQEKNLLQTKRQLLRTLFSDKQKFGSYLTFDNYQTIYFGEVSQHISKRVDPALTDLKVYVGLEHLDPDNIMIERHGTPSEVKGTKLLVCKDDVIFGKRRAYQRKVAVSHFEGICSAHSMVLRAKEDAIKKDFLPYFMQSDVFMDRAVQISEGSLSPTIKWKVLEKQKFSIPKKEFQEKLTVLFKNCDKLIYELKKQTATLKELKQNLLDEILG